MTTAATIPFEAAPADSGVLQGDYGRLAWRSVDGGYRCRIDGCEIDCRLGDEVLAIEPGAPSEPGAAPPNLEAAGVALLEWLLTRHPDVHRITFSDNAPPAWHGGQPDLLRSEFFQRPAPWYRGDNAGSHPLQWIDGEDGLRRPQRRPLPDGELYRRHIRSLGMDFSLRRLRADFDLDRLTRWMNDPRIATFWEHAWPRDEQAQYIDKVLADSHLQPVIGCFDDTPFAYFELYWALEDRIGPYYDAGAFDRGMHLLVGEPEFLGRRFTQAWLESICHFMFLDDDRTERLVGEPQADNEAMLKYIGDTAGWRRIKAFDFPHKSAVLVACERADFFEEASFA